MTGTKVAVLANAGTRATDSERVELLAAETVAQVDGGADSVACVANSVRRARAVHARLKGLLGDDVDLALLIGPQRPVDRARFLDTYRGKLFDRETGGRQLVVVATQTFEVGLDADVEAMVMESASMHALVQRLGRLNRSGRREGRATIVRDPEPWLYGEDERGAWEWLERHRDGDEIDVSVAALERSAQSSDWPRTSTGDFAPALPPDVVAQLAQTDPRPGTWQEPDIEAYLRGVGEQPSADVTVCWRADLRPELVGEDADEYRSLLLAAAPPRPHEQITISVSAARALIVARCLHDRGRNQAARLAQQDADVDLAPPAGRLPPVLEDPTRVPFVVVHRGEVLRGTLSDEREDGAVRPRDLEPGDVVVLPTAAGGCDEFGLAPAALGPARDVAADVIDDEDGAAPVRITPEAIAATVGDDVMRSAWLEIAASCGRADQGLSELRGGLERQKQTTDLVRELADGQLSAHPGIRRLVAALDEGAAVVKLETIGVRGVEIDETESGAGDPPIDGEATAERRPADPSRPLERAWVLVPKAIDHRDELERGAGDAQALPTLEAHALAVRERLARALDRLQLSAGVRGALLLAASVHDHGKADPRFQDFLYRGVRPLGAEVIAKSEFGTRDKATARRAARVAGLPTGFAHEGASVAVLEHALAAGLAGDLGDVVDLDLAVVAVGTHHGRARPLPSLPREGDGSRPPAPFFVEAAGVVGTACGDGAEAFVDGAWLRRLAAVNRRYGAWGTAYLVGALMLADRAVSSEGS